MINLKTIMSIDDKMSGTIISEKITSKQNLLNYPGQPPLSEE
jgi:hypothetical protein